MNSKRIISLILSIIMTLQVFVFQTPVHAMESNKNEIQKSEGQRISDRSEVFTFNNTEKPKMTWFSGGTQSTLRARSASLTRTENLKINTEAFGLDEGEKEFDWKAFGSNQKFTAWVEVAYVGEKNEQGGPLKHKVSEDIEISEAGTIETQVQVDAQKTVDKYYLRTEYQNSANAFKIQAFFEDAPPLSPEDSRDLTFTLGIYQIVSTKIEYNLIDEYGKAINLNDAKEEKPAVDDLKGLGKIGDEISFDLKNTGEEILWQEQGIDEWDLTDSSLAMTLTKNEIKSNNIDYKLTSTYDVLDGGKVTIQRQKDAVTPKDPHNPGNIPEGYARINLSADATGAGPTGTFTKDDDKDNRRVVDVKAGKAYTTAQAEVDKQGKPFPLTSDKKVDTGKTFDKWTPELSTLGIAANKETKTLNATYKSSDVEIIPYLPDEEVPTKDKDGLPIPTDYVTVTFKSEDAEKGKVKIGDKVGETVLAKVKPGIDLSKKAEITTVPAENYGFTEWKPVLGKAAEGQTYTAHFVKSGDKINEGDPIPKDWLKVTVSQDESIVDNTVEKAIYTVKSGDKLSQDKFADLKGKAKDGYKDPAWYVGSEKLEKPYEKEITTSIDFLASATEEIANKFKTNPLKAVDITAYKGDEMGDKFWNKGLTTQSEDAVLERILEEATVTDTTDPARTTEKAGTFPGTLKVTFSDGSYLEVNNQRLIVIDTEVDINFDQGTDKDANAPRHKDEVVKGKIDSKEILEGAKVEILDSEDKVIGTTLVTNTDGSFIAGTRPLQAGETIKVRVTLPKADKASPAVEKQVQLNPDELNNILPTADKVYENFNGKPGVSKDKVDKLKTAIDAGKALIDADTKKPAKSVPVTDKGQEQLDEAYKAIKAAIKDLTENKIPEFTAPSYKEIFVGDDINLDDGVTVTDDNIKQVDGKDYSYKIYDGSDKETTVDVMKKNAGTYRVVYKAEDTQGVTAEHTMTVVVKKTVVEVPGEFPDPVPNGYVKVEFKSGEHAGLNGVSKFLVKKDAPKSEVKEPTIVPKEGYKVADPKWSVAIPETFATDFETEAQVLAKATTTEPDAKDKDKYATLTFEAGDHGTFEENAKTTIYVLKNEKVQFNAPKVNANDGFTFAKWDPELKESYDADATHIAQYASNSDISETEVKDFQEVKFLSGTDGKFEGDKTEKSIWVRPGKLVDLRTKAPKVTVTTEGKSHIGWDQDLVQTFTKADQPTVINAKYDDTVKTEEPKDNKDKYAKVDFVAGNLGTIADDATKTYWVVKDAEVTLTPPTVTAKEGWKVKTGNDAWSPEVATKYTQDTIHVAQYDYDGASVVPQEPGDEKPNVPENFVKVEFKKGEHGVISSEENFIYWVDPTKEVELTAPAVIADTNYKHTGWKKGETVVDLTKANKFEQATDLVAQYKATVVTEDPQDENYVTVEFDAKEHGTLTGDAKFWVYKNEKVSITAPKVTAKDGYTFDKWDPAVKDSYDEATVHNATYTTNNNVSDTEVEGYNKVTFKVGDHGTLTEKSVWVKPDTLVDLSDKAPEVTPAEGYSHIGWEPGLVGKFADGTEIVAQYSNNISDTPVEGWIEILFNSGEHGRFENGTKNTVWVNPDKAVSLDSMKDKLVPFTNYSFDKWQDAKGADADLATAKMYKEAAQFTAVYKSNIIDDEKDIPENEKDNFVKITFEPGENGKFAADAKTTTNVRKNVEVDLTEKAPTVIPNQGYGHSGWNPELKGTFSTATTITAQYKAGTFDENAIKEIMVVGPTKMGYGVGEKLDLAGLKVIAKDDAGLQKTYEGVEAIEKAGFTIAPADKTELKMEDNGKHIVVTKGEGNNKVTGQTETTLTIHENKSAKAEDVKALNQNKVEDGKVTDQPKDTTTVTGKVTPGSTIKITDKDGKDITPQDVTIDENGNFTAEVEKQKDGDKVKVIVTEPGKQDSEPTEATVARDANNDGKADNDADQKTATPTAKALNQGADPKTTTITGKAEPGAKVVAKVGDEVVGEATADQDGNYTIEAKKENAALPKDTEVKVTAQIDGKLESEPATTIVKIDKDGNGVADDEEQFDIKKATKVEIIKNPDKMNYLVNKPEEKAKFETAGLVVKFTDDSGKSATYTAEELANMEDVTIKPANDEEIGLTAEGKTNKMDLTVTVTGAEATEKPTVKADRQVIVKLDADGNGIADEDEKTPEPEVYARNIGENPDKTTVEVETEPKAKVIIEYKDKETGETKKIEAEADGEGKLTKEIQPKLDPNTEVKVTVKDGEKQATEKTVKVFDDLDNDKKPDTEAGQTERPAALASNIGKKPEFTTITGEAEKGATVTAKVGNEVVGTATADKETGKYTIQAKQNDAPIKEGVKIDVTAKLAPKDESLKQTVVVFKDTDGTGQPDSAKDFDPKKTTGMQVVASPDKMVYSDGDQLNLDGLKVLLTDVNGNQKIFTYNNAKNDEFTGAGLSVDYKQNQKLTNADNDKKLTVTLDTTGNTHATEAITGETPTALTVNKNQSAQPTDVVAANQGEEEVTKVKGKATKDAEIKITDADGNNLLPEGKTIKADNQGEFTADLNKLLDPGTKVFVTATESGKSESPKAETPVIRDKDGDWETDTGAKLSTPVIDPIREKDEKVVVEEPKADDKIQTITVEDQKGNKVTLTKDSADKTGKTWTVEGSDPAVKVTEKDGKLEIPVKDKLPLNDRDQIKVTFKDGENPANEVFDKAPVQKASQTPKVDPVYTGDKSVKIADPTVADPTAKTIKVKVGDNDSMTVEKQGDGSWKVKEDPNKEVKVEDGKIVVPLDPSAKKDEVIKVSTINDSGKASPAAEVKVVDKVETKKPTIDRANKDENSVSGTAAPNAEITVTVTPKDGEPKTFTGKADGDGNYKVTTDPLVDGDTIVVTATEPGKADNTSDPKVVGVDTSKLKESIDKAEEIGGEDGANLKPDTNKVDKELKDALDEAKKVKEKGDNADPNTNQAVVDKAKEDLDKAIAQKEADTAVDKAKDDPTPDNIGDAQNKIDAIPGSTDPGASDHNPIKKELQDKLDLIKKIKEGEDRLKQDDIEDKPTQDVKALEKAIQDGKNNLKENNPIKIVESIEKINKSIKKLNEETLVVKLVGTARGSYELDIRTSAPRCKVTVTYNGKELDPITTDPFGQYALNLGFAVNSGDTVVIKAEKPGYKDARIRNRF